LTFLHEILFSDFRKDILRPFPDGNQGVFMKYRFTAACLSLILIVGLSVASYGEAEESQAKALISDKVFEFKPVLDGTKIVHDFIIQNSGNATLEIEKIETG
jgi:hypothetical protein